MLTKNLDKTVNFSTPSDNGKAQALWMLSDAKTNGEAYYDRSSERQIVS